MSGFHSIRILSDELAPVRTAVRFCLLGSVLSVVHVLAFRDRMANSSGHGISGIEKLGVFFGLQDEMHHLGHLFLRGVAVARDGLFDGFGEYSKMGMSR